MVALNPAKFVREVRVEMNKVVWPPHRETMISTMMVLLLAGITALFFITVDWVVGSFVRWILGMGV